MALAPNPAVGLRGAPHQHALTAWYWQREISVFFRPRAFAQKTHLDDLLIKRGTSSAVMKAAIIAEDAALSALR